MKKILAILVLTAVAVAYAQQGAKSSTTLDAASCFKVEGITSLQVERGPEDYLILHTDMKFENFTDMVLGDDKKQEIWLKDLDVTVSLTDTTTPPSQTRKLVDGKMVVTTEYSKVKIGKVAFDDFIIPKSGLSTVLPIAMDQVTKDGGKKEIINPTFDKFVMFFNLMNGTPKQRETARIVFEGTCKVAIKGENNTWMWAPTPINFVWLLKPENTNTYILKIVEDK